jgi:hypothetical protein
LTVHSPTARRVIVEPSGPNDVQMLGVVVVNVTWSPEDAVALASADPLPSCLFGIGGNVMV